MSRYKHLVCFDLSSYGAAAAILNRFVNGENILDFEISPIGTQAQLVLLFEDHISMQVVHGESQAMFKSEILNSAALENIQSELLSTYLGQNKTEPKKHICILESGSLASAFEVAKRAFNQGLSVLDFRVVRTSPKNVILVLSGDSTNDLAQFNSAGMKMSLIENIQPRLRSYYEIKK